MKTLLILAVSVIAFGAIAGKIDLENPPAKAERSADLAWKTNAAYYSDDQYNAALAAVAISKKVEDLVLVLQKKQASDQAKVASLKTEKDKAKTTKAK